MLEIGAERKVGRPSATEMGLRLVVELGGKVGDVKIAVRLPACLACVSIFSEKHLGEKL